MPSSSMRDGIVQSAVFQIARRFRMAMELRLIEGGRLVQQLRSGRWHQLLLEMRDSLTKRQMEEEFDKTNQVATAATAVAVEQILADIDVKGRTGLLVEGTQPDKLMPRAGTRRPPVVTLQVLQQRDALFEPFQILGHGAVSRLQVERRRKAVRFPGKDGGRQFVSEPQGPETGKKREYAVPA